jgi:hypothetical protein
MNELTLMNSFVIAEFQSNNLVNTMSIVETDSIDLNKENIYALVNLDLTDTEILDDAIIVSYKITIVQSRDVAPRKTDSKLLNDTNYVDNLNETHSIAQRFLNVLRRQNNDGNIELDGLSELSILNNWRSGLDGVQFDVDLSIPNIGRSC